jgi:hypothetical protein
MNPWVTGRIVEQIQIEARNAASRDRTHRDATREAKRERVGLAVARLGLRIAGRKPEPAVLRRAFSSPKLETRH